MLSSITAKHAELASLCRAYHVARLELFGSAASGAFNPETSDLDFLVEFQPGFDLGPWLTHYFNFQRALTNLFGCKADLIMPGALRNPYFIREVNSTRRVVYAA